MPVYKCENYSNCDNADRNNPIELSSAIEPKCPLCGLALKITSDDVDLTGEGSVDLGRSGTVKIAIAVFAVLALGGGAYWGYQRMNAPVVLKPQSASVVVTPVDVKAPTTAPAESIAPGGMAPSENDTATLKKAADEALLKNKAAEAEATASRAAANELIKSAVAKIAQGKLPEADDDLHSALKQDPKSSLAYYNLGIIKLRQNNKADALRYFESSFESGFPYFDKIDQDQDLATLRKDPLYIALIAKYKK